MRAEGRLLVAFVQIAILNGVLGPQISLFRHIGQWETEIACAHISVGKFGLPGINSQLLRDGFAQFHRSEENTSELQSIMRISYAVLCLQKKKTINRDTLITYYEHKIQYKTIYNQLCTNYS